MFSAFGSRQVAQIYAPNNAYQVIMRVAPEYQRRRLGAEPAAPEDARTASTFRSRA